MPGLGTSFGRGAMTNHWIDVKNADAILIMGSNAAENHPIAFKWVEAARERGATLISVDPRFTRTSTLADIYAPLRSGTDILFLGAMINHVLRQNLVQREYVVEYTNAPFLLDPAFGFKDGYFSGWDPEKKTYDRATWKFQVDADGTPRQDKTPRIRTPSSSISGATSPATRPRWWSGCAGRRRPSSSVSPRPSR